MKTNTPSLILVSMLAGVAFLQPAQAVVPPPDGGYPGFNTAEGTNALKNLTTGVGNTAVGWFSLKSDTDGSLNTAVGAGTLLLNIGDQSTTEGLENTAVGAAALLFNTTGSRNTAVGAAALLNNNIGIENTATGDGALLSNTIGAENTAVGFNALLFAATGYNNTACGWRALNDDTSGGFNTAVGSTALTHSNGIDNTAIGVSAGSSLISGDGNVYIGSSVVGEDGVSNTTYIRNVYDSITTARQVYVDANNKIGTLASTRRVKDDIESMARASETILALRPVTFRYKKEIDRYRTPQFGLVAEEVAEINPDLVTRDREGKPETVRYDAVNAMLLNEFLKEHEAFVEEQRRVQEQECRLQKQETTIARQQEQIDALTAGLQKVSAQVATSAPSLADSR